MPKTRAAVSWLFYTEPRLAVGGPGFSEAGSIHAVDLHQGSKKPTPVGNWREKNGLVPTLPN
jgi:hypothetical protein